MGPEFFQTGMGRRFYEHDVPRIADSLVRIAESLEKLIERIPKKISIWEEELKNQK